MAKKVESIWTKDITHHVVGSLAVFGLIMSSLVTTLGVTTLGVNVEMAFAQQESATQTAALAFAERHPGMDDASTTLPRPVMNGHMGSTTLGLMNIGSSTPRFCPTLSRTIGRGRHEATTTGDVGKLQTFIAEHFNLDKKDLVTGTFGSTTQALVQRFQMEQGIPTSTTAGPLTRAAIARLCGGDRDNHMGSTTPMMGGRGDNHQGSTTLMIGDRRDDRHMGSTTLMGSSTEPLRPQGDDRHDMMGSSTDNHMGSGTPMMERHDRPMPPRMPSTSGAPTSYNENSSNAAALIEAVNEIGDGYAKLLGAAFGVIGL